MKKAVSLIGIILLVSVSYVYSDDKSPGIASFIESKVNSGGFSGCSCRSIGENLVQCDIRFPAGTNKQDATTAVEGVSDMFAQVGAMASTIYYTGYVGSQRVCEFIYDMTSRRVKRKF